VDNGDPRHEPSALAKDPMMLGTIIETIELRVSDPSNHLLLGGFEPSSIGRYYTDVPLHICPLPAKVYSGDILYSLLIFVG
jgi:hypothetical protein